MTLAEKTGAPIVFGPNANPGFDAHIAADGERLKLGAVEIEVLHTPGHTPGSQCFKVKNTLISGDTLFINGCGRVDLPGSNAEDMYHSMCKLCSLPDDTLLLPGHNYGHVPNATMGETKKTNLYLRIDDLETWSSIMGH